MFGRDAVIGSVAAVVVAGLSGCSGGAGGESSAPAAPRAPQVIIDGQPQPVSGGVTCHTSGDSVTIGIGHESNGVGAVLSTDNPPLVRAVGLGSVRGVTLGYSDSTPGQLSRAGVAMSGNTYTIKGTANGTDLSNPQTPREVSTSFEMDVACP